MKPDFVPEELTLLDPSPANSHYAETFVYAPANTQERLLGSLYILASVCSAKSKKENAQLVAEIANIVKNEYYKNTITTPLSALRFALKKANGFLAKPKITEVRGETVSTKIKSAAVKPEELLKMKVAVAVLKHNTLHLAKLGEVAALILRHDSLQPITIESPKNKIVKIEQPVCFENIVSGEITSQDCFILATNHIHKISDQDLAAGLRSGNLTQKITLGEKTLTAASGLLGLSFIALRPTPDGESF